MSDLNFFDFFEKMKSRPQVPAPVARDTLTVSQLTQQIDRVIREGLPGFVSVRGELSNCSKHRASGHLYCTLKDAGACIDCVMFRDDAVRVKFQLADGLEVIASGRVAVYAQRGRYQLYITSVQPVGKGALELAFQQLRKKLEGEGFFAAGRKKSLPKFPASIALVTSRETAALQDILKVLRRFPWVKVKLAHVAVQGDGAGQRIADALGALSREAAGVDIIIVARGGGSLEDLWAFNEEVVARAIAASRIPIITGIGHEVDVTIADLVADYHAHTPTEAAAVATMHWRNVPDMLEMAQTRLRRGMRAMLADAKSQLSAIARHETFRRPMHRIRSLEQFLDERQRLLTLKLLGRFRRINLDALAGRLAAGATMRIATTASRLDGLTRQLEAVNPLAVLRRGYSMTMMKKDRTIVRSADQIKGGETLLTRLSEGEIESVAENPKQRRLF